MSSIRLQRGQAVTLNAQPAQPRESIASTLAHVEAHNRRMAPLDPRRLYPMIAA